MACIQFRIIPPLRDISYLLAHGSTSTHKLNWEQCCNCFPMKCFFIREKMYLCVPESVTKARQTGRGTPPQRSWLVLGCHAQDRCVSGSTVVYPPHPHSWSISRRHRKSLFANRRTLLPEPPGVRTCSRVTAIEGGGAASKCTCQEATQKGEGQRGLFLHPQSSQSSFQAEKCATTCLAYRTHLGYSQYCPVKFGCLLPQCCPYVLKNLYLGLRKRYPQSLLVGW